MGQLIESALGDLANVEAAAQALKALEAAADTFGLPLAGEPWGARLGSIKKKGGGSHFDEALLGRAGEAHRRLSSLASMVAWRGALRTRQTQASASAVPHGSPRPRTHFGSCNR